MGPYEEQTSWFSRGLYLQRCLAQRESCASVSYLVPSAKPSHGLFDKILENIFFSLWESLWRLFRWLMSTRFVIYVHHHYWPGLDSLTSLLLGSRRILLSREILLLFHCGVCFPLCLVIPLRSVSSLNAYLRVFRINRLDMLLNLSWLVWFPPAPRIPFGRCLSGGSLA